MADIAPPAVEPDPGNKPAFAAFASAVACQATTIGSAAFTPDIPARRRAERALRDGQMPLASALEDLPPGVAVSSRHANLLYSKQPLHDHVQRG
mgnify:CR=1 FL=1